MDVSGSHMFHARNQLRGQYYLNQLGKILQRTFWDHCQGDSTFSWLLIITNRFFEVDILKSVLSKDIESLDSIFSIHGIPCSIRTDNGLQFISEEFKDYLRSIDVRHVPSTPLWPQSNGEVERGNRSLLKVLKMAEATGNNWRRELN